MEDLAQGLQIENEAAKQAQASKAEDTSDEVGSQDRQFAGWVDWWMRQAAKKNLPIQKENCLVGRRTTPEIF